MWYVYTAEFYSAIKKNEIIIFRRWMILEIIMLSKKTTSSTKTNIACFFSLWNVDFNKRHESRRDIREKCLGTGKRKDKRVIG
jgi:hypothetical protein